MTIPARFYLQLHNIFPTEMWKIAKGVVIPKPGKSDYSKVRAYRVISLLDVISKLLERTAAHLITDHLERRKERGLHEGQFGCRKRRSCIDAVAILMNRTQRASGGEEGARRAVHGRQVGVQQCEQDTPVEVDGGAGGRAGPGPVDNELHSDRQVKIALDGEMGEAHPVDTGVPQGSPAAPILVITYLSGIFDEVENVGLTYSRVRIVTYKSLSPYPLRALASNTCWKCFSLRCWNG